MKRPIRSITYSINDADDGTILSEEFFQMPVLKLEINIGSDGKIEAEMELDELLPEIFSEYYGDITSQDLYYVEPVVRMELFADLMDEISLQTIIEEIADFIYMKWAASLTVSVEYEEVMSKVRTPKPVTIRNRGEHFKAQ